MKLGIIQQRNVADATLNRRRLSERIRALAAQGAALVVLQELHDTPYFCQTENVDLFDLATPIPGEVTAHYADVAREAGVVLVTGLLREILLHSRRPGVPPH